MNLVNFVMKNYVEIIMAIGSIISIGQVIVRLTPTESDDGFVTKLGKAFDGICDFLKIPNNRKGL